MSDIWQCLDDSAFAVAVCNRDCGVPIAVVAWVEIVQTLHQVRSVGFKNCPGAAAFEDVYADVII